MFFTARKFRGGKYAAAQWASCLDLIHFFVFFLVSIQRGADGVSVPQLRVALLREEKRGHEYVGGGTSQEGHAQTADGVHTLHLLTNLLFAKLSMISLQHLCQF